MDNYDNLYIRDIDEVFTPEEMIDKILPMYENGEISDDTLEMFVNDVESENIFEDTSVEHLMTRECLSVVSESFDWVFENLVNEVFGYDLRKLSSMDCDYECDVNYYTTKSGEDLVIVCHYGYD